MGELLKEDSSRGGEMEPPLELRGPLVLRICADRSCMENPPVRGDEWNGCAGWGRPEVLPGRNADDIPGSGSCDGRNGLGNEYCAKEPRDG